MTFFFRNKMELLKKDPWALQDIENKTPELCKIAVSGEGMTYQFVPEKLRTLELKKLAVSQNGLALAAIKRGKTIELCKMALQQNGQALASIPRNRRLPELCRVAVQQSGTALRYVPSKVQEIDPDICRLAVMQDGTAIRFVQHQTKELCEIALKQTDYARLFIDSEIIDSIND